MFTRYDSSCRARSLPHFFYWRTMDLLGEMQERGWSPLIVWPLSRVFGLHIWIAICKWQIARGFLVPDKGDFILEHIRISGRSL